MEHGISCSGKTARQMTRADYDYYDHIVIMDGNNAHNILYIIGDDPDRKVHLLMEYAGERRDVADPWYTGDFEATWQDVNKGCKALLRSLSDR